MTTADDQLARDLLAHFADPELPATDDEDSVGYTPTAQQDVVADLAAEIDQLRTCGFLPDGEPMKSPRDTPTPSHRRVPVPIPLRRVPRSLPAECRDPVSALQWWDQQIVEDPQDGSIYLERAKTLFKLGRFEEAVMDGQRSTYVDAGFMQGHVWTGTVLLRLGRLSEAEIEFAQCPSLAPDVDSRVLQDQWTAAQVFHHQGRFKDCVAALDCVVEHTTHSTEIKRVYIDACRNIGRWLAIIKCLAEWLAQAPFRDDSHWRLRCAEAYYGAAMPTECLRLLDSDSSLEGTHAPCKEWRQRCQWAQSVLTSVQRSTAARQPAVSVALLTEAIDRSVETPVWRQLFLAARAQALRRRRGGIPAAIRDCTAALEDNEFPWSVQPLALRAACYARTREVALAMEDYERLLALQPDHAQARRELRRLQDVIPDLYAILGVPPNATVKRLNTAYHRLLLQYHPDRQHGQTSEELRRSKVKFHELYDAFMMLSDPARRTEYDEFRAMTISKWPWSHRPGALRWGIGIAVFLGVSWLGCRYWATRAGRSSSSSSR